MKQMEKRTPLGIPSCGSFKPESLFGMLGYTSKQNNPCFCGADILAGKEDNKQMMYMAGDEHCDREKQVSIRGMGSFPE